MSQLPTVNYDTRIITIEGYSVEDIVIDPTIARNVIDQDSVLVRLTKRKERYGELAGYVDDTINEINPSDHPDELYKQNLQKDKEGLRRLVEYINTRIRLLSTKNSGKN